MVPWKEGRQASVKFLGDDNPWLHCVGVADGGSQLWESVHDKRREVASALTRALLHQCPKCFAVGAHAEDCIVAENLKAGVPEFWARWARFTPPQQTVATVYQWSGCDLVRMWDSACDGEPPRWAADGVAWDQEEHIGGVVHWPWVAIGPDGAPTTEPWEGE